ncbi:MAG: N-acetylmuramoyl-L-alanine amidase, partial [Bacteroidota bacterium]
MVICRLFFPVVLLFLTPVNSFSKNNTEFPPSDKFIVVLDAGHGGHDPGNLGNGYLEKNIALRIVLEAGKELEKNPDIQVIYTRKDDTFVDLYVRGKIANEANADLFVSVHCDSHTSDAYGAGTFVLGLHANRQNFEVAKKENSVIYLEDDYEQRYAQYDINSPESVIGLTIMQEEFLQQSILLGTKLQDNFTKKLNRKDRKVKQAGFIVLHQTFMPSVLIETGFLTNKKEGSYLNSSKGQTEMGRAIAKSIIAYKEHLNKGVALDEVPTDISENEKEIVEEAPIEKESQKEIVEVVPEQKDDKAAAQEKETSAPSRSEDLVFKVQLLASSKSIPL